MKIAPVVATAFAVLASSAAAQTLITSQRDIEANSSEARVSYNPTNDKYRNFGSFYNQPVRPYVLSPYMMVMQPQRPATAPMPKYTDVEYGKIVEQVVNESAVQPAGARASVASILDKAMQANEDISKVTVSAKVVDVLDRGLLVLDTYDEVKLRGVDMESENEIDEVTRYYSRVGIDALRRLLQNGAIQLRLGRPERSSNGPILAEVYTSDGTFVNRMILEQGLGRFDAKDYQSDQISITLQAAEQRARQSKVGHFSQAINK